LHIKRFGVFLLQGVVNIVVGYRAVNLD